MISAFCFSFTIFRTYSDLTIHFGPALNLIIAPNGCGKSTLVNALCLGLGGDPKFLGRASHLGDFVKHGCNQASIEVELKGPTNIVIKRNLFIKRTYKDATWLVNGRPTTVSDAGMPQVCLSIFYR